MWLWQFDETLLIYQPKMLLCATLQANFLLACNFIPVPMFTLTTQLVQRPFGYIKPFSLLEQAPCGLLLSLEAASKQKNTALFLKKCRSLLANSTFPLRASRSCQSGCQSHRTTESITKATINIPACQKESRDKGES